MESNKELIFDISITFPHILERVIQKHNQLFKTDFEIIATFEEDGVPFCKLRVSKYIYANIFYLGSGLTALEYDLRQKGEIDW